MNLQELKSLLALHPDRHFRVSLPDGSAVPHSFHVTEVGRVQKDFLDCGGTLRQSVACQLQIWVGEDYDHRIETRKMSGILAKAATLLPDETVPVELEYEDRVISQYTIRGHRVEQDAVILELANKHTECLAPELCGLPPLPGKRTGASSPCCGPQGCC